MQNKLELTGQEIEYLRDSDRCKVCGHLEVLHQGNDLLFCMDGNCPCNWTVAGVTGSYQKVPRLIELEASFD